MKRRSGNTLLSGQEKEPTGKTGASLTASSEQAAIGLFLKAKYRLLDVDHWADFCGPFTLSFQLADPAGDPLGAGAPAVADNYIKATIPGSREDGTSYWLRIEKAEHHRISENYELFLLQLRPCADPGLSAGKALQEPAGPTQQDPAASSFTIERDGQRVNMTVYGGNETPDPSASFLPAPHWQALIKGLLSSVFR